MDGTGYDAGNRNWNVATRIGLRVETAISGLQFRVAAAFRAYVLFFQQFTAGFEKPHQLAWIFLIRSELAAHERLGVRFSPCTSFKPRFFLRH